MENKSYELDHHRCMNCRAQFIGIENFATHMKACRPPTAHDPQVYRNIPRLRFLRTPSPHTPLSSPSPTSTSSDGDTDTAFIENEIRRFQEKYGQDDSDSDDSASKTDVACCDGKGKGEKKGGGECEREGEREGEEGEREGGGEKRGNVEREGGEGGREEGEGEREGKGKREGGGEKKGKIEREGGEGGREGGEGERKGEEEREGGGEKRGKAEREGVGEKKGKEEREGGEGEKKGKEEREGRKGEREGGEVERMGKGSGPSSPAVVIGSNSHSGDSDDRSIDGSSSRCPNGGPHPPEMGALSDAGEHGNVMSTVQERGDCATINTMIGDSKESKFASEEGASLVVIDYQRRDVVVELISTNEGTPGKHPDKIPYGEGNGPAPTRHQDKEQDRAVPAYVSKLTISKVTSKDAVDRSCGLPQSTQWTLSKRQQPPVQGSLVQGNATSTVQERNDCATINTTIRDSKESKIASSEEASLAVIEDRSRDVVVEPRSANEGTPGKQPDQIPSGESNGPATTRHQDKAQERAAPAYVSKLTISKVTSKDTADQSCGISQSTQWTLSKRQQPPFQGSLVHGNATFTVQERDDCATINTTIGDSKESKIASSEEASLAVIEDRSQDVVVEPRSANEGTLGKQPDQIPSGEGNSPAPSRHQDKAQERAAPAYVSELTISKVTSKNAADRSYGIPQPTQWTLSKRQQPPVQGSLLLVMFKKNPLSGTEETRQVTLEIKSSNVEEAGRKAQYQNHSIGETPHVPTLQEESPTEVEPELSPSAFDGTQSVWVSSLDHFGMEEIIGEEERERTPRQKSIERKVVRLTQTQTRYNFRSSSVTYGRIVSGHVSEEGLKSPFECASGRGDKKGKMSTSPKVGSNGVTDGQTGTNAKGKDCVCLSYDVTIQTGTNTNGKECRCFANDVPDKVDQSLIFKRKRKDGVAGRRMEAQTSLIEEALGGNLKRKPGRPKSRDRRYLVVNGGNDESPNGVEGVVVKAHVASRQDKNSTWIEEGLSLVEKSSEGIKKRKPGRPKSKDRQSLVVKGGSDESHCWTDVSRAEGIESAIVEANVASTQDKDSMQMEGQSSLVERATEGVKKRKPGRPKSKDRRSLAVEGGNDVSQRWTDVSQADLPDAVVKAHVTSRQDKDNMQMEGQSPLVERATEGVKKRKPGRAKSRDRRNLAVEGGNDLSQCWTDVSQADLSNAIEGDIVKAHVESRPDKHSTWIEERSSLVEKSSEGVKKRKPGRPKSGDRQSLVVKAGSDESHCWTDGSRADLPNAVEGAIVKAHVASRQDKGNMQLEGQSPLVEKATEGVKKRKPGRAKSRDRRNLAVEGGNDLSQCWTDVSQADLSNAIEGDFVKAHVASRPDKHSTWIEEGSPLIEKTSVAVKKRKPGRPKSGDRRSLVIEGGNDESQGLTDVSQDDLPNAIVKTHVVSGQDKDKMQVEGQSPLVEKATEGLKKRKPGRPKSKDRRILVVEGGNNVSQCWTDGSRADGIESAVVKAHVASRDGKDSMHLSGDVLGASAGEDQERSCTKIVNGHGIEAVVDGQMQRDVSEEKADDRTSSGYVASGAETEDDAMDKEVTDRRTGRLGVSGRGKRRRRKSFSWTRTKVRKTIAADARTQLPNGYSCEDANGVEDATRRSDGQTENDAPLAGDVTQRSHCVRNRVAEGQISSRDASNERGEENASLMADSLDASGAEDLGSVHANGLGNGAVSDGQMTSIDDGWSRRGRQRGSSRGTGHRRRTRCSSRSCVIRTMFSNSGAVTRSHSRELRHRRATSLDCSEDSESLMSGDQGRIPSQTNGYLGNETDTDGQREGRSSSTGYVSGEEDSQCSIVDRQMSGDVPKEVAEVRASSVGNAHGMPDERISVQLEDMIDKRLGDRRTEECTSVVGKGATLGKRRRKSEGFLDGQTSMYISEVTEQDRGSLTDDVSGVEDGGRISQRRDTLRSRSMDGQTEGHVPSVGRVSRGRRRGKVGRPRGKSRKACAFDGSSEELRTDATHWVDFPGVWEGTGAVIRGRPSRHMETGNKRRGGARKPSSEKRADVSVASSSVPDNSDNFCPVIQNVRSLAGEQSDSGLSDDVQFIGEVQCTKVGMGEGVDGSLDAVSEPCVVEEDHDDCVILQDSIPMSSSREARVYVPDKEESSSQEDVTIIDTIGNDCTSTISENPSIRVNCPQTEKSGQREDVDMVTTISDVSCSGISENPSVRVDSSQRDERDLRGELPAATGSQSANSECSDQRSAQMKDVLMAALSLRTVAQETDNAELEAKARKLRSSLQGSWGREDGGEFSSASSDNGSNAGNTPLQEELGRLVDWLGSSNQISSCRESQIESRPRFDGNPSHVDPSGSKGKVKQLANVSSCGKYLTSVFGGDVGRVGTAAPEDELSNVDRIIWEVSSYVEDRSSESVDDMCDGETATSDDKIASATTRTEKVTICAESLGESPCASNGDTLDAGKTSEGRIVCPTLLPENTATCVGSLEKNLSTSNEDTFVGGTTSEGNIACPTLIPENTTSCAGSLRKNPATSNDIFVAGTTSEGKISCPTLLNSVNRTIQEVSSFVEKRNVSGCKKYLTSRFSDDVGRVGTAVPEGELSNVDRVIWEVSSYVEDRSSEPVDDMCDGETATSDDKIASATTRTEKVTICAESLNESTSAASVSVADKTSEKKIAHTTLLNNVDKIIQEVSSFVESSSSESNDDTRTATSENKIARAMVQTVRVTSYAKGLGESPSNGDMFDAGTASERMIAHAQLPKNVASYAQSLNENPSSDNTLDARTTSEGKIVCATLPSKNVASRSERLSEDPPGSSYNASDAHATSERKVARTTLLPKHVSEDPSCSNDNTLHTCRTSPQGNHTCTTNGSQCVSSCVKMLFKTSPMADHRVCNVATTDRRDKVTGVFGTLQQSRGDNFSENSYTSYTHAERSPVSVDAETRRSPSSKHVRKLNLKRRKGQTPNKKQATANLFPIVPLSVNLGYRCDSSNFRRQHHVTQSPPKDADKEPEDRTVRNDSEDEGVASETEPPASSVPVVENINNNPRIFSLDIIDKINFLSLALGKSICVSVEPKSLLIGSGNAKKTGSSMIRRDYPKPNARHTCRCFSRSLSPSLSNWGSSTTWREHEGDCTTPGTSTSSSHSRSETSARPGNVVKSLERILPDGEAEESQNNVVIKSSETCQKASQAECKENKMKSKCRLPSTGIGSDSNADTPSRQSRVVPDVSLGDGQKHDAKNPRRSGRMRCPVDRFVYSEDFEMYNSDPWCRFGDSFRESEVSTSEDEEDYGQNSRHGRPKRRRLRKRNVRKRGRSRVRQPDGYVSEYFPEESGCSARLNRHALLRTKSLSRLDTCADA